MENFCHVRCELYITPPIYSSNGIKDIIAIIEINPYASSCACAHVPYPVARIDEHGCHPCLSQRHTHLWTWQCLYRCWYSLEAVFVVASLAHLMGYLDDNKVTLTLLGNVSYTLQEWAVKTYDETYMQGWHLTLSRDVVCLSRPLSPHIINKLRLIAYTWQRMLVLRTFRVMHRMPRPEVCHVQRPDLVSCVAYSCLTGSANFFGLAKMSLVLY